MGPLPGDQSLALIVFTRHRRLLAGLKSRRTSGRWFYVSVTLLIILLSVVSFAPSIIDGSTRTVSLPLNFIDLAHTLVSVGKEHVCD